MQMFSVFSSNKREKVTKLAHLESDDRADSHNFPAFLVIPHKPVIVLSEMREILVLWSALSPLLGLWPACDPEKQCRGMTNG